VADRAALVALSLPFAILVVAPVLGMEPAFADSPEDGVEFQDGDGNTVHTFSPGRTATFYVKDTSLGTIEAATATWTEVTAQVDAGAWWSLATGEPQAASYGLSQNSAYDRSTPANTPLKSVPAAKVNGVTTLVADLEAQTGRFTLLNDVNQSSTLAVTFDFDIVDTWPADLHRASVTSTADTDGEWVSIEEVASATDATASPTSSVYRGEVILSGDSATSVTGDGKVWVRPGDDLVVTYFDADGATAINAHQVEVVSATTTPLPALDGLPLALLAVLFTLAALWRTRRSSCKHVP
jgi:hypothetical protein